MLTTLCIYLLPLPTVCNKPRTSRRTYIASISDSYACKARSANSLLLSRPFHTLRGIQGSDLSRRKEWLVCPSHLVIHHDLWPWLISVQKGISVLVSHSNLILEKSSKAACSGWTDHSIQNNLCGACDVLAINMSEVDGNPMSKEEPPPPPYTDPPAENVDGMNASANARTEDWKVSDFAPTSGPDNINPDSIETNDGVGFPNAQHRRSTVTSNHRSGYDALDLLSDMKDVHRLLDLYGELSSGGLVEKIIINQDGLCSSINDIAPKAYHSLTRIDFGKLDLSLLKLIGLYGSKTEIVRFLESSDIIDQRVANLLRQPLDDASQFKHPSLRSGIYLAFLPHASGESATASARQAYVIYWPEDTTWEDSAINAVQRNRDTFMRYLTRLCDQIIALISPDHASKFTWRDEGAGDFDALGMGEFGDIMDNSDRFMGGEVIMQNEQEDGFSVAPGFLVKDPRVGSQTEKALEPRLVSSECQQAFLTSTLWPERVYTHDRSKRYNPLTLKATLAVYSTIHIHDEVTLDGLKILLEQGHLRCRAGDLHEELLTNINKVWEMYDKEGQKASQRISEETKASKSNLERATQAAIARALISRYGFDPTELTGLTPSEYQLALDFWDNLATRYSTLSGRKLEKISFIGLDSISASEYKKLKQSFLKVKSDIDSLRLTGAARQDLIRTITRGGNVSESSGLLGGMKKKLMAATSRSSPSTITHLPDPTFISDLPNITREEPLFQEAVRRLTDLAVSWAQKKVLYSTGGIVDSLEMEMENMLLCAAKKDNSLKREQEINQLWSRFREAFCNILAGSASSCDADLCIASVAPSTKSSGHNLIKVQAHGRRKVDAQIQYSLHTLELTQDDKQHIQQDFSFIPKPRIHSSAYFCLTVRSELKHIYLLPADRCLLVVESSRGISLYLSEPHSLANMLSLGQPTKHFPRSDDCRFIFALDELKHQLVVVMTDLKTDTLTLHSFVFDETFTHIHSRRSATDVTDWYQDGPIRIHSACFISGTEDLCLVEESGRLRIYSFMSQLFRTASVELASPPIRTFSTPDGSALITVESDGEDGIRLRAFHVSDFGSNNDGIMPTQGPRFKTAHAFEITSLEHRGNAHLLSLSLSSHSLTSTVLQISSRATTFQMQSQDGPKASGRQMEAARNCLIDCVADVWTRYPVVPAVKRTTISPDTRAGRSMTYVAEADHERFLPYFKQMIRTFENKTQKPTEQCLDAIEVQSFNFATLIKSTRCETGHFGRASSFKAGEWFVELLCLIPLHIAVARNNEFVPLNNGVIDPFLLEQRLLGADVPQIVDALRLGWYESIFNSYMATKPVKVVSSMGEQSVGKSYALNHFIDSSFAGSAVRTTEGVWLSVCPTPDLLIVALDFEGVHSIERSPQEDMLLVLFNTAISNMVLFRNNFALNREIANMFTSFQSSTSSLDPASNPQLFKGQLVVIVKDVVDGDKDQIGQEFRSKLGQIVMREQATNFLTLLHAGQYLIVPWPVVHSRAFYTLFSGLKSRLLGQKTTHRTAGEFLQILKTLMAKLKAKDWTTLSQTLTKHRVATLTTRLSTAISSGYTGHEADIEPLRNLEDQTVIPSNEDTDAQFCISESPIDIQWTLKALISQWKDDAARHNIQELERHLQSLVEARIRHVGAWLTVNLRNLSQTNSDVQGLMARFRDDCVRLRSSILLCGARCASCHLPCLLPNLHEQSSRRHDCGTSHKCPGQCYYDGHGDEIKVCGLSAGHTDRHMCDPTAHCCGAPCIYRGKEGCQETCTKKVDHDVERNADHVDLEHVCPARLHQCGEPCDLKDVQGPNDLKYSCPGYCVRPHDEVHDHHACDAKICPITCELCLDSCAEPDHFHGLRAGLSHFCGHDHRCSHLCAEPGICEVLTTPQSVETTFDGRYSSFQYTKFTQSATRLPCAIPIPPGVREHSGGHIHSAEPKPFHHCEISCPSCGYICHLPFGHSQAEHETAHGSMDNTAWVIEGTEDPVVEVQGHRYAPHEAGTPHMCNLVCSHQGRHVHIDYCRALDPHNCQEADSLHIDARMEPYPKRPKDWVSHAQFWKRTGFRDPYSKDEQAEFLLCDVQCGGPEHKADATRPAPPSFCTLPMFHSPQSKAYQTNAKGYVSSDGHSFLCPDPNSLGQNYHIMFVLDRSSSMKFADHQPMKNTPLSALISARHKSRFGAVLSAVERFMCSQKTLVSQTSARRDAYSVILFNNAATAVIENEVLTCSEQMLELLVKEDVRGGTEFDVALSLTREIMERYWTPDLIPAVIFLSDGESSLQDKSIYGLFDRAVALGTPLSFHAVYFGDRNSSYRSLERIVSVGNEVGRNAKRGLSTSSALCTFTHAIDTVQLSNSFENISSSLKKPRAALMRGRA